MFGVHSLRAVSVHHYCCRFLHFWAKRGRSFSFYTGTSCLIQDGENIYYVLIKDLNRLCSNRTKDKKKKHVCRYCLTSCTSVFTPSNPSHLTLRRRLMAAPSFVFALHFLVIFLSIYFSTSVKGPENESRYPCSPTRLSHAFERLLAFKVRLLQSQVSSATTRVPRAVWTKHGHKSLILPNSDTVMDLTICMDVSPNPGPFLTQDRRRGNSDSVLIFGNGAIASSSSTSVTIGCNRIHYTRDELFQHRPSAKLLVSSKVINDLKDSDYFTRGGNDPEDVGAFV